MLTPEKRKLARHALGLDNPQARGRSYRNRYEVGIGSPIFDPWHEMVTAGLAERSKDGLRFRLTRYGAEAALYPGETLDPEDFPTPEAPDDQP